MPPHPRMWLDVDPENYANDVSVRGIGVAAVFATLLVPIECADLGQHLAGVNREALGLCTALYFAACGTNVGWLTVRRRRRPLRPRTDGRPQGVCPSTRS